MWNKARRALFSNAIPVFIREAEARLQARIAGSRE